MDALTLMQKMREQYAVFDTYCDSGTVVCAPSCGPGVEFETHFQRPAKYSFRWRDWHPYFGKSKPASEHGVYSDGRSHKVNAGSLKETQPSLQYILAIPTGVTAGSVINLVNLLMPGCMPTLCSWQYLTGLRVANGEFSFGGMNCFCLIATMKKPGDTKIWIEKERLVVRKIELKTFKDVEVPVMRGRAGREHLRKALQNAGEGTAEAVEALINQTVRIDTSAAYETTIEYNSVILNEPVDQDLFVRF